VEQRDQGRGSNGRFLGFWARLNCEHLPLIPAWLLRRNLDDLRRLPYLLLWKSERDGEIKEVVRLTCERAVTAERSWFVELKRPDETATALRIVWRMLPRNSAMRISWRCRSCARLRYSSEGGCLRPPSLGPLGQLGVTFRASWGNLPRPGPWLPYVLTSIDDLSIDEIIGAQLKRGTLA